MENTILKLELSVEEVNVLIGALVKLPIEVALPTLQKIQQQAESQINKPQENVVVETAHLPRKKA